jgi:6-phosphogluconolactonase
MRNRTFAIKTSLLRIAVTSGSPFAGQGGPCSIAFDPMGKFVYATNQGSNTVSVYQIDPGSGAPTAVAGSPFAAGQTPSAVAVDPTGEFVYVANAGSGDISAYAVDAMTGALTPVPGSPFAAGSLPYSITVSN